MNDNDLPFDPDEKSKSQIKREMKALQDVGQQILNLSDEQLTTLPISDRLRAAVVESRRITQHEARRRHLQYVGKVMRQEDELESIMKTLAAFDSGSEEHTRRLHLAERWRERLLTDEGNDALTEFLEQFPGVEVQHLRNLVRNARREVSSAKNTGQARKLFRFIREKIDEQEQA